MPDFSPTPGEAASPLDSPPGAAQRVATVDRQHRVDLVSFYFSQGKSIPQIVRLLQRDHGYPELTRDLPYHDLSYATNANWLTYRPPMHLEWKKELKSRYGFLMESHIPKDGERMAVVAETARLIARSINHISKKLAEEYGAIWEFPEHPASPGILRRRQGYPGSSDPETKTGTPANTPAKVGQSAENVADPDPVPLVIEIRIGVSGGRSLGATIMELGRVLVQGVEVHGVESRGIEDQERYLKDLVVAVAEERRRNSTAKLNPLLIRRFRVELRLLFVNLVSGFEEDPFNHPIAYITAMINSHEVLESRAEMKCFCATPFVRIGESGGAEDMPESPAQVKEFVEKYGLDIIVTSAGCLDDPHSTLNSYYGRSVEARQLFAGHGVVGDFLWMPLKANRPFSFEEELSPAEKEVLKYRPMTLLNLKDLAEHVRRGHDVVLMISPCGQCFLPKGAVLKAVLDHDNQLVTHLISDRRSVGAVLGKAPD